MKDLIHGNILLIICCGCYLLWWIIAFNPEHSLSKMITSPIIVFAAAIGIVGGYLVLRAISATSLTRSIIGGFQLLAIGAIVYVALLLFSMLVLKRPVTTELLLIVGWAVLQISYTNVLYGTEHISLALASILILLIIAFAVVSFIAYLFYYQLAPMPSYIDGMIPLVLVMVMMIVTTFFSM
jgi:hypothetical protein